MRSRQCCTKFGLVKANTLVVAQFFLFSSSSSLLLSPFLHLWILLHLLHLRECCVKDPTLAWLVLVSVEDLVRNFDRAGVSQETKFGTKRKLSRKLGSDVLHSSKVTPHVIILIMLWIDGASVDG